MLTVRLPNGQVLQYNDACWLKRSSNGWALYTADPDKYPDAKWVASIQDSAGAIVEARPPCRIYKGKAPAKPISLEQLAKEVRLMRRTISKQLFRRP